MNIDEWATQPGVINAIAALDLKSSADPRKIAVEIRGIVENNRQRMAMQQFLRGKQLFERARDIKVAVSKLRNLLKPIEYHDRGASLVPSEHVLLDSLLAQRSVDIESRERFLRTLEVVMKNADRLAKRADSGRAKGRGGKRRKQGASGATFKEAIALYQSVLGKGKRASCGKFVAAVADLIGITPPSENTIKSLIKRNKGRPMSK